MDIGPEAEPWRRSSASKEVGNVGMRCLRQEHQRGCALAIRQGSIGPFDSNSGYDAAAVSVGGGRGIISPVDGDLPMAAAQWRNLDRGINCAQVAPASETDMAFCGYSCFNPGADTHVCHGNTRGAAACRPPVALAPYLADGSRVTSAGGGGGRGV